jgi:hypothetical protein
MGPPSHMGSVVDRNVVMRRIPVFVIFIISRSMINYEFRVQNLGLKAVCTPRHTDIFDWSFSSLPHPHSNSYDLQNGSLLNDADSIVDVISYRANVKSKRQSFILYGRYQDNTAKGFFFSWLESKLAQAQQFLVPKCACARSAELSRPSQITILTTTITIIIIINSCPEHI